MMWRSVAHELENGAWRAAFQDAVIGGRHHVSQEVAWLQAWARLRGTFAFGLP